MQGEWNTTSTPDADDMRTSDGQLSGTSLESGQLPAVAPRLFPPCSGLEQPAVVEANEGGTLASPGYYTLQDYGNDLRCAWLFVAPEDKVRRLLERQILMLGPLRHF